MHKCIVLVFLAVLAFSECESSKDTKNVFVIMKDGTSGVLSSVTSSFTKSTTHGERTTALYKGLTAHAVHTQKPVLQFLEEIPNINVQSFWINNYIYIQNATGPLISTLKKMDQVFDVEEEQILNVKSVFQGLTPEPKKQNTDGLLAEWGLEKMSVPMVWNMAGGVNGSGLIVGNIDTGVRATHELLRDKWVGLQGYGWFDPENKTSVPFDNYNHGTLTIGAIVGDKGIGVAPGSRWMSCKGYRDDGSGLTSTFVACGQYMLCPVDYQGNNEDCSKAPQVVSGSFGIEFGSQAFEPVLQAWISAGILSSFSAGNYGAGNACTTGLYTPAEYNDAICVGATGRSDELASFSSLGPSRYGRLKPEISGPGIEIYTSSAASDTAYASTGGTSLSCPLVSGVLVLLKNKDPNLSHHRANDILKETAVQNTPRGVSCGGVPDSVFPNNHIGHGRVDAYAAMRLLISGKTN